MSEHLSLTPSELITQRAIEYLAQRVPNINELIEALTASGLLDQRNLSGGVVDIGTFLGAGVLAIEKYGPASIVGVDSNDIVSDGTHIRAILKDRFVNMSITEYLRLQDSSSLNLLAALYSNIGMYTYIEEAERVLAPGGQLLVTTNIPSWIGHHGTAGTLAPIEHHDWIEYPDFSIATMESYFRGSPDISGEASKEQDRFVYIYTKPQGA